MQQFRQLVYEQNPSIQMVFPMAEVVNLLQEGVGYLLREAGLKLMNLVMEEEVPHLAGERHEQHTPSAGVPLGEQRLRSYELFQRSGPLQHAVWDQMIGGCQHAATGAVVNDFRQAYEVEKSVAGAAAGRVAACAVLTYGTPFKGRQMMVVLGISQDGRKIVPSPAGRGDGEYHCGQRAAGGSGRPQAGFQPASPVHPRRQQSVDAAVHRHAGVAALIQRCQVQQAAQRARPLAGRTQSHNPEETAKRLCHDGICGRQARPPMAAS